MRFQSLAVLGVAILLGLLAVFGVNLLLSRGGTAPAAASAGTTNVVVAAVPLTFGSKIGPEQLKIVKWPADAVPPGIFRSVPDVSAGEPNGRIALQPMQVNEPVLASKVSGKGGRLSLSGLIGENMRAATVRVNDVVGVGGFLLPGDKVDVFVTRDRPRTGGSDSPEERMTDLLVQNVRVLGVDSDANVAREKPAVVKTVTLEVTRDQAMKLTLAQSVGTISLSLRNLVNKSHDPAVTLLQKDLRDDASPAAATAVAATTAPKRFALARRATPRHTARANSIEVVRGLEPHRYSVPPYRPS